MMYPQNDEISALEISKSKNFLRCPTMLCKLLKYFLENSIHGFCTLKKCKTSPFVITKNSQKFLTGNKKLKVCSTS